ncbi:MAG: thiamine ABC transporter substrate-binding protein [Spirochaetales bacterium]|nr:thiamine ABC transporter substrate-binding protein [Spirochaetales bacterium]
MIKKTILIFFLICSFVSCSKKEKVETKSLTIYCYDAFASEWGTGPAVIPVFEEDYGIKVNLVACGDSVQMLNKVLSEKKRPKADLILGFDNSLLSIVKEKKILQQYRSSGLDNVDDSYIFDKENFLTPYNYGFFSIIYDSSQIEAPKSLDDLLDAKYEKQLIMIDPRTSTVGLGFLLWTLHEYEDSWLDYWGKLSGNILTISDSWDRAYGLFTLGEAQMVLSYTTSPAYHIEYENQTKYKAAIFEDGHYIQIEGAGIVAGTKNLDAAKAFIDFMLSNKFQDLVPLTNFMYPVSKTANLPESFLQLERPSKFFELESSIISEKNNQWISSWRTKLAE